MNERPAELKYCQQLVHEYIVQGIEEAKNNCKYKASETQSASPRKISIVYRIGEELKKRMKYMKKGRFGVDDVTRRQILMDIISQHSEFLQNEFRG